MAKKSPKSFRSDAIREALKRDKVEDIPEDAPKKEGRAVLESPSKASQDDREEQETETVEGTPDKNLEGRQILKRGRAPDTAGDTARMRPDGGRAAAASRAVGAEHARAENPFDASQPQEWQGGGDYSYSYTPGDRGQAGRITVTHPDGRRAVSTPGDEFYGEIIQEWERGDVTPGAPEADGVTPAGDAPKPEPQPGDVDFVGPENTLGESPSADYIPGQVFEQSLMESEQPNLGESEQPVDPTAYPPGYEAPAPAAELPPNQALIESNQPMTSATGTGPRPGAFESRIKQGVKDFTSGFLPSAEQRAANDERQRQIQLGRVGLGGESQQPAPEPEPAPNEAPSAGFDKGAYNSRLGAAARTAMGQSPQPEPDLGQSPQPEPDLGQSPQPEPDLGQSQRQDLTGDLMTLERDLLAKQARGEPLSPEEARYFRLITEG